MGRALVADRRLKLLAQEMNSEREVGSPRCPLLSLWFILFLFFFFLVSIFGTFLLAFLFSPFKFNSVLVTDFGSLSAPDWLTLVIFHSSRLLFAYVSVILWGPHSDTVSLPGTAWR